MTGRTPGTGSVTQAGTGTLILTGMNSYSGGTSVTAGTLQIGDGSTPVGLGGNVSVAVGATLAVFPTDDTTYTGVLSGQGTVTKLGPAVLTLTANNNPFTDTLVINEGTVVLEDPGTGGDLGATAIVVNAGGKFQFDPNGNPDLPANTVITVNPGGVAEFNLAEDYGGIALKGGAYNTRANHNFTAEVTSVLESGTITNLTGGAGALAGAGSIRKTTAVTVTVTGVALNVTGGIAIDDGVLSTNAAINASGVLSFGTSGTGATGGTLQYRGATATVGKAVTLNAGGGTVDVTTAGTVYTLSGVISGTGPLTKAGPGTLALSGANSYTGPTTLAAGALLVNGNQSAATGTVDVTGGTLGGRGTLGGAVAVGPAGRISPGTDTTNRTLAVNNALTIDGGTYVVNLFGTGSENAGTVAATGAVVLSNGPTLELNLNGLAAADLQAAGPTTYTIVTGGVVTGTFVQPDFTAQGFNLSDWSVATVGNTVVLSFTPVPEPATVLGLAATGLGLAGVLRRVRRRRSVRRAPTSPRRGASSPG